jgi:hypothetical protein
VIAALFFLPVIIYNIKMYQARGHFDLQIATLLGQDISKDWPGLVRASKGYDPLAAFNLMKGFNMFYSLPMYLLIMLSLVYIVGSFFRKFKDKKNLFLLLALILVILEFSFIGLSGRFLSIFNPFFALAVAVFVYADFWKKLGEKNTVIKWGCLAIIVLICAFEFIYNLNTNFFAQPYGQIGKNYSAIRHENTGFNQLEDYLVKEGDLKNLVERSISKQSDLMINLGSDVKDEDIYIYDPNLNWFSTLWYFRRWSIYYHKIFISAADLSIYVQPEEWIDFFKSYGAKNIYYIRGANDLVFDAGRKDQAKQNAARAVEGLFYQKEPQPALINNLNNQLVFKVYTLKVN